MENTNARGRAEILPLVFDVLTYNFIVNFQVNRDFERVTLGGAHVASKFQSPAL